ncbi:unnamed protein product [Clavelina lepadiformis]|uniref:Uncharacterized protein n=1 Tax=Clavelina lepadiformis TaxID=159417 RepID=A0ABP0F8I3_CLALP
MGADVSSHVLPLKEKHHKPYIVDDDIPSKPNHIQKKPLEVGQHAKPEQNQNNNRDVSEENRHETRKNKSHKSDLKDEKTPKEESPKRQKRSSRDDLSRRKEKVDNSDRRRRKRRDRSPRKESSPEKSEMSSKQRDEKQSDAKSRQKSKQRKEQGKNRKKSSDKTEEKNENESPKNGKRDMKNRKKGKRKSANLAKDIETHRSVPDLNSASASKVGAWLNSAVHYWPQDSSPWSNTYPYPYASTLPNVYGKSSGEVGPHQIVDGMGSPVGTMFPDGSFQVDQVYMNEEAADFRGGSLPRFGMNPYFGFPYPPYPYMMSPHVYMSTSALPHMEKQQYAAGSRMGVHRSRSYNEINKIAPDDPLQSVQDNRRKLRKQKVVQSMSMDDALSSGGLGSPRSQQEVTGTYFNDISETRRSIHENVTYRANQEISVDAVKHAEFHLQEQNFSSSSSCEEDSDDDSSNEDSSSNDIVLDTPKKTTPTFSQTPKTLNQAKTSNVTQILQPLSEREVFIDDVLPEFSSNQFSETHRSKATIISDRTSQNVVSSESVPHGQAGTSSEPIMRLCEKESIVATSFLTSGGKVFCIKRTKSVSFPNGDYMDDMQDNTGVADKAQSKLPPNVISQPAESGTWFGLTGSPPFVKEVASVHGRSQNYEHHLEDAPSNPPPALQEQNITASKRDLMEGRLFSPRSASSQESKGANVEVKRIFAKTTSEASLPIGAEEIEDKAEEQIFSTGKRKSPSSSVSVSSISSNAEKECAGSPSFSFSDSEPTAEAQNSPLASKLVRIDSHDSLTMKRRLRYHRRSSSQTEGAGINSFDRRATIAFIPHSDLNDARNHYERQKNIEVTSPSHEIKMNPFKHSYSLDMNDFLHRAKSVESLKQELSRSNQALMAGLSPRQRKETLQERAARILGLGPSDLERAKQRKTTGSQSYFSSSSSLNSSDYNLNSSTTTKVTPSSSAKGNISHSSIRSTPFFSRSNSQGSKESESFAVSVTDSMLHKCKKYEIRNVDPDLSSDESSVSVRSEENVGSHSATDSNFIVAVNDSVLEGRNQKGNLRVANLRYTAPTEYKLPDEILTPASNSTHENTMSPSPAQASIVASYSGSIYDHTPRQSLAHSQEYSDDTSESESLDHSGQYRRLPEVDRLSEDDLLFQPTTPKRGNKTDDKTVPTNIKEHVPNRRVVESPVPIASHSAPLTSAELDIIMQLYNSADESASTCSRDVEHTKKTQSKRATNGLMKQKVAQAIGFNVKNIDRGKSRSPDPHNLGKIEDFDIKIFPGRTNKQDQRPVVPSPKEQTVADNGDNGAKSSAQPKEGGVLDVVQSLGLDPDQTWIVSL